MTSIQQSVGGGDNARQAVQGHGTQIIVYADGHLAETRQP